MSTSERELRERVAAHGQEHLFAHWEKLDDIGRARLSEQLAAVDFDLVEHQAGLLRAEPINEEAAVDFAPPQLFPLERDATEDERAAAARARGEQLLAEGKVGFLLVAGGQASRLGYDGPKGAFPVGPVSGRSLFEIHARRLLAAQERHGRVLPWYVMTSAANDATTREFFGQHQYFGLDPDQVAFFSQAMIPALDLEGRILMAAGDSLFLAPNGHGGTLTALASSGCLADARSRGVTVFSYFQVDNPLVRPADTLFLGLHDQAGARMSSKVVAKRDAAEKVGVLGLRSGELGCIEYSDLPPELREQRDASGRLLFGAGNVAAHLLALDFIEELTGEGLELPWHVARKRMKVLGTTGAPEEVEGAKFETFIFDALGRSPVSVTLEVDRSLEFSPVKNAEGEDSPASARRDLCRLFATWIEASGGALPDPDGSGVRPVEVDPLLAEDASAFEERMPVDPVVTGAGHLYEPRAQAE
jgi:UDP-N-acetylglucosamine/UDP-N-acetylgalactosamine diphosphorylase